MVERTIKGMHAKELKSLYEETINDINTIKAALNHIEEQKNQASESNIQISGDENTEGILAKVREMEGEASDKIKQIKLIHDELLGDENGIKSGLDDLLEEFSSTQAKIKSAEKELNGYQETQEGEEKHVDGILDKVKKFLEVQKVKYSETFDKIENELLGGATTVGLSKAYSDKADLYKIPNMIWLFGFFISISIIVAILIFSLSDIHDIFFVKLIATDSGKEALSASDNQYIIEYLIVKSVINIGIITSLIWVASFTGKRYSQNKRLSEEYSYKATFAKSFEGYRKRAEELDQLNENKELSEALMKEMIKMSAFNPVETMESESHKENHPTTKTLEKAMSTLEKTVGIIDRIKK